MPSSAHHVGVFSIPDVGIMLTKKLWNKWARQAGDSYWVPTSRDEYPDMRLSRLPQVDYVVSKQSWVGRLLQRPNFELTQLMFFMNRLKQPGGQAFLSSDPAPLGANLLNWTARQAFVKCCNTCSTIMMREDN